MWHRLCNMFITTWLNHSAISVCQGWTLCAHHQPSASAAKSLLNDQELLGLNRLHLKTLCWFIFTFEMYWKVLSSDVAGRSVARGWWSSGPGKQHKILSISSYHWEFTIYLLRNITNLISKKTWSDYKVTEEPIRASLWVRFINIKKTKKFFFST